MGYEYDRLEGLVSWAEQPRLMRKNNQELRGSKVLREAVVAVSIHGSTTHDMFCRTFDARNATGILDVKGDF